MDDKYANSLIGKIYVDDTKQSYDSSDDRIVRQSELPQGTPIRILAPDTIVTMEYCPNRWNLHLDKDDKVIKVRKG
jgi:hypothetical protein